MPVVAMLELLAAPLPPMPVVAMLELLAAPLPPMPVVELLELPPMPPAPPLAELLELVLPAPPAPPVPGEHGLHGPYTPIALHTFTLTPPSHGQCSCWFGTHPCSTPGSTQRCSSHVHVAGQSRSVTQSKTQRSCRQLIIGGHSESYEHGAPEGGPCAGSSPSTSSSGAAQVCWTQSCSVGQSLSSMHSVRHCRSTAQT
jgi:hypothetical protein